MERIIKAKCPYCEHENEYLVTSDRESKIVYCDIDNDGCDRRFVLDFVFRPIVEVFGIDSEMDS